MTWQLQNAPDSVLSEKKPGSVHFDVRFFNFDNEKHSYFNNLIFTSEDFISYVPQVNLK